MNRRQLLAALALITASPAIAEAAPAISLTAVLDSSHAPAIAGIALSSNGIVWQGALGRRRENHPDPVTTRDSWHIGSNAKAMTAAFYAKLVEQGRAHWDTPVSELFGDVTVDPTWNGIGIHELITHHAGIDDSVVTPENWPEQRLADRRPLNVQRTELVAHVFGAPPTSPVREYKYSNVGMTAVGAAIERILAAPWESAVTERVFRPLGMSSAGFGAPTGRQPWGHADGNYGLPAGPVDPTNSASDNPPILGPAGTVHMRLSDHAKFVRLFLMHGGRFLTPDSITRLSTPYPAPGRAYAMGWAVVDDEPWTHGRMLAHDGSNGLWYERTEVAPGRDIAIITASNDYARGQRACVVLARRLQEAFAPA